MLIARNKKILFGLSALIIAIFIATFLGYREFQEPNQPELTASSVRDMENIESELAGLLESYENDASISTDGSLKLAVNQPEEIAMSDSLAENTHDGHGDEVAERGDVGKNANLLDESEVLGPERAGQAMEEQDAEASDYGDQCDLKETEDNKIYSFVSYDNEASKSVLLHWISEGGDGDYVCLRNRGESYFKKINSGESAVDGQFHVVALDDLDPGTDYDYRIISGNSAKEGAFRMGA